MVDKCSHVTDPDISSLSLSLCAVYSWFHSQEINVMVDSKQIVDEWMAALGRNQSTKLYGMVDQRDGIWRGRDGKELVDTGKDKASESEKRERSSSPPASTSGAVSATTATTATVVSK